jgi:hypothetical protein
MHVQYRCQILVGAITVIHAMVPQNLYALGGVLQVRVDVKKVSTNLPSKRSNSSDMW